MHVIAKYEHFMRVPNFNPVACLRELNLRTQLSAADVLKFKHPATKISEKWVEKLEYVPYEVVDH